MIRRLIFVILLWSLPALATVRNVVTCGAAGNGTTDDTAAINSCIALLVPGDTLLFPAGTYKVTSALTRIAVNNVTIDGSSGAATVKGFTAGQTIFQIGGVFGTGPSTNLTATANELSQTISANFAGIGASAGSYILIEQGPTGASGQRGEVLQLASAPGIVTTMVHDTFSTSAPNEVANVRLLNAPVSGITMQNIVLDGDSHVAGNGLNITNLVNSTITGVTFQNFTGIGGCAFNGAAFAECYTFGVVKNNITITGTGNNGAGGTTGPFQSGYNSLYTGNDTITTMTINSGNGGGTRGVFAFAHSEGANLYVSGLTIDATTNGVGRPFKIDDCRYCSFPNLSVTNQPSVAVGDNGLTFEYFTAHVLVSGCTVTGIAGSTGQGIHFYGDDNGQNEGNVSFNTVYGCTVSTLNPATDAFAEGTDDVNNTILGGTWTVSNSGGNKVIETTFGGNTSSANFYVSGASITPGLSNATAIAIGTNSNCVNNNTIASGFGAGINVSAGTGTTGTGNTLNGNSSNLTAGVCPSTTQGSGALATLSPTSLSFGNQTVNSTSGPLGITITNGIGLFKGASNLSFVSAKLTTGTQFAISGCTASVAPGASCSFTVTFTPTSVGSQSDTLTLLDNAGGAMQTIPLSGTGTAACSGLNGPPTYPCVSRSTAALGNLSAPITPTSTFNQTWYDSLNPTTNCKTQLTDASIGGVATPASIGGGNVTWSGGMNDHMISIKRTYAGITLSTGPTAIFHLSFSNIGGSLCAQNVSQGGENPGISIGGAFSFSTTTDNVFYNLTSPSGGHHPILNQNTITSDTTFTTTSNSSFPFDFNNCPGITAGNYQSSGILGVTYRDGFFSAAISWTGAQGTGSDVLVYRPGLGCARLDLLTGHVFTYCLTNCSTATPAFTETACTDSKASTGLGVHDSQISGLGDIIQISGGCFDQLGAGNIAYWQVNTGTVYGANGTTGTSTFDGNIHIGGHDSVATSHLWYGVNPSTNLRVGVPLTTANLSAFTILNTFPTPPNMGDFHAGFPRGDTDDSYAYLLNTNLFTGQSFTSPPAYQEEIVGISTTPGTPIRFGPNYNSGTATGFGCANSIGSVSQDGEMMLFLTDSKGAVPGCVLVAEMLGSPTQAATPTISPAAGTYTAPLSVTGTITSANAHLCWNTTRSPSTDNVLGCASGSTLFTGNVTLNSSATVYFVAGGPGYIDSAIASAAYTMNQTAAAPIFTPGAGTYAAAQSVTISTSIGSVICYTTNGTTPATNGTTGCSAGTKYTTPVSVAASETLKAIAGGTGFTDGPVASAAYVINTTAVTPTFLPVAGTYAGAQSVVISTLSGSIICYTTNGSTPATNGIAGCTTGTLYSGPVVVSSSETLKAVAGGTGFNDSPVGSAAYVITTGAATPTFSPVAGTYTGAQNVTISSTSGGAVICYTTNGTNPATNGTTGCTTGTLYSGPVSVAVSETLKAVAGGTGFTDSSVGSAAYVIKSTASTPTFSPVAGTYTGTQTVTISSVSSGAIICWNTTGTPQTNGTTGCTRGTLYAGPISVSVSETVYAVAGGTNWNDSTVGSAVYTINSQAAVPLFSPPSGTYAGTQSVSLSTSTGSVICYTTNGSTPQTNGTTGCTSGTLYSTPISVSVSETVKAIAGGTGFTDSAVGSAIYTIVSPSTSSTITGSGSITGAGVIIP